MSFGSGSSSSTTEPVDMTPAAFAGLQGPFARRLAQLLGLGGSFGGGGTTGGTNMIGGTATAGGTPGGSGAPGAMGTIANFTLPSFMTNTGAGRQNDNRNTSEWRLTGRRPDGGYTYTNTGSGKQISTQQPLGNQQQTNGGTTTGGGGSSTFSDDPMSGIPTYGGPLTAELGGNEQQILDMLMGRANGTGGNSFAEKALMDIIKQQGVNVYKPQGSLAQFADMLSGASNTGAFGGESPFLDAMIKMAQRTNLEGLTETLTRDLPGRFTQAGQMVQPGGSSAFDRAAAIATRGVANANADIATKISYDALEGARGREAGALGSELDRRFQGGEGNRNRSLDAAKALPGVSAIEIESLIKNLQAQGLPRLIQDQGIDRGLDLFKTRLDSLMKVLGVTAGVTQPTIAQRGESDSSQFQLGIS